jgi:polyribonucleotide nucleotidyltransferase
MQLPPLCQDAAEGRFAVKVRVEKQIGQQLIAFETGWLAKQADATVIASIGDNMVLSAVTSGPPRLGQDFFPLTVDYRERVAAAGKFPGGFIKRDGRPSIKETLTSRLIDRPLRPLFPDGFIDEVQIQCMVLSSDRQQDADLIAMNASAAALYIADLPFQGPIAGVRLARVDRQWVAFPNAEDLENSDLDLVLAGSESAVMMIEGFAREMPEEEMLSAIHFALRQAKTCLGATPCN